MKITRVVLNTKNSKDKSLAVCSLVFEDCLKLNNIRLFKNQSGYYLVLPSKQDIYQEVSELNSKELNLPENESRDKEYEEFFFPLKNDLYETMLKTISSCFSEYKKNGCHSFRF